MKIGVVSDTHIPESAPELPPELLRGLEGVDLILHGGDILDCAVLDELETIAPVRAVRGNMDRGPFARHLRPAEMLEVAGLGIYVLHDLNTLDLDPCAAAVRVVISGHTHRPQAIEQDGVLYLNPGSAGYPRGHHPPSVALLHINGGVLRYEHIALDDQ